MPTITVDLKAKTGTFETDIQRSSKQAQKHFREMERAAKQFGVALGAAAVASVTALAALTKKSIDAADNLAKMSQKVGVSVETLSTLGYAADRSGVSIESLQGGLVKLAKNAGDAAIGTGEAIKGFDALGISVKDAEGKLKNNDVLLREIAAKFATFEDSAQKTALAVNIFGRSGAELIPLLNEGADGIQELEARARSLGLEISTGTAKKAEEFNDLMEDMGSLLTGIGNDIARELLPSLTELTSAFVDNGIAAREGSSAAENIADAFKVLIAVGYTAKAAIEAVTNVIAAQIDIMIAAGKAAYDVFENYGSLSNIAYKLANGTLKPLNQINKEFSQTLADTAKIAGGGIESALTDLSDAYSALFNPTTDANEAIKGTGEAAKGAAPELRDLKKEAAEAEKAAKEAAKQWADYEKALEKWILEAADVVRENNEMAAALRRRFDEQAQDIQTEIYLLGLSTAERERATIALQAEALARDDSGRVIEEQRLRYEALLHTLAEARKIEAAAAEFERIWLDAADSVGDALTTALFDGADAGADAIKGVMEQLARDLVRFWLQQNIVIPLQQQLMGGAGGGIFGGAGGLGGSFGTMAAIAGISSGNPIGGALGGLAFASGSTGAGLIGSGLSSLGLTAGLGIAVPIVGAVVGALLANALGGSKPPDIRIGAAGSVRKPETNFSTVFGDLQLGTRGENPHPAIIDAITQFDNAIAGIVESMSNGDAQLDAIRAALSDWAVDLKGDSATIENVLTARFGEILATFDEDTQAFVRNAGDLQAQVQALAEVLARPGQIQAILDALQLEVDLAAMTEAERALFGVNQQFDGIIEQLEALGASEEQLAQAENFRALAIQRLSQAQEAAGGVFNLEAAQNYAAAVRQIRTELANNGLNEFVGGLADISDAWREQVQRLDELARAAGLAGAREEDLADAYALAEQRRAQLIGSLTASIAEQVGNLFGTSLDNLQNRLAGIDAGIAQAQQQQAGSGSFGFLQGYLRERELTQERALVQAEIDAAQAEAERLDRQLQAVSLSQNLADLAGARGVDFATLFQEFGFAGDELAAALGIEGDALNDYLLALQADSYGLEDLRGLITAGDQAIIDAIYANTVIEDARGEDLTKPLPIDTPPGGKSLEVEDSDTAVEVRALRETVEQQTEVTAILLQQIVSKSGGQEGLERVIREFLGAAQRNVPRSDRLAVLK